MDRSSLLQNLAMAERHVAKGGANVLKQEELIAEMNRNGHDTNSAQASLITMRETQALRIQYRDRILRELKR